jgi:hypothetical protein
MLTKTRITFQEAHELRRFVRNLETRRITTPEFKSVLMILRPHCAKHSGLYEWTNSVAHKKRDRGTVFTAGAALWVERFHIEAFFNTDPPRLKKIPIPIFEKLLSLFRDPHFNFDGINMKAHFPGGHSKAEILASINFMYRRIEAERVYKLISVANENIEDLTLMRHFISRLKATDWGEPPFHFDEIRDDIATAVKRLIGAGQRAIKKNCDLLATHFLTAFHLTEVDLKLCGGNSKTRCFLTVDSTLSGHLSLNLGLYQKQDGEWDSLDLAKPNWNARMSGSHQFTRPFLCTDLEEKDYFINGTGSEISFKSALIVKSLRGSPLLQTAR